jgi:hypothetical protein
VQSTHSDGGVKTARTKSACFELIKEQFVCNGFLLLIEQQADTHIDTAGIKYQIPNMNNRICITPKDVMRITGRGIRYSRDLLKEIAQHLNKPSYKLVTIQEFCDYTKMDVDEVRPLVVG